MAPRIVNVAVFVDEPYLALLNSFVLPFLQVQLVGSGSAELAVNEAFCPHMTVWAVGVMSTVVTVRVPAGTAVPKALATAFE